MAGSSSGTAPVDAHRILVVEDDPSIASGLVRGLRGAGFEVVLATVGEQALQEAAQARFDLVLLDLNLPDMSGFDVLDALGARHAGPVIVLTARTELEDRLQAFDRGAMDFLPKPFWLEELVARIRLRLGFPIQRGRRVVAWDGVEADLDARTVRTAQGEELGLTPHEFNVLALLLQRPGNALTREQIATRALPPEGDRQDRTVDSHVSRLRRKLGAAGNRIRTVWGIGYRFDGASL